MMGGNTSGSSARLEALHRAEGSPTGGPSGAGMLLGVGASLHAALVVDVDGRIVRMDEALTLASGWKDKAAEGCAFEEVLGQLPWLSRALDDALTGRVAVGESGGVRALVLPSFAEGGRLLGACVCLGQEEPRPPASESQEALVRELRRAQRHHDELINNVDGIVWEADTSFHFTFVSKQAERLLGYPTWQWLGEPDFWVKHLHPEDRDWACAYCTKATKECRPHALEYRMVAADGHIVWLRDIVTVSTENGSPRTVRGIMVDVTEQRQVREQLEESFALLDTFLNNAPIGLGFLSRELRFIRLNDALAGLHGRRRDEEVGHTVREMTPSLAPLIEPLMRQVLETGEPIIDVDLTGEVPATPGQRRHWSVSYYPVQTPSSGVLGVGAVVVEVTAERRARAERERLLHEAREAIRVRDDFLSIASHELKTPLTPLRLHLQRLQKRSASGMPIPPQLAEKALAQLGRLSGLICDLLDSSQVDAGNLEVEREPVSLREVVQQALADFSPACVDHTLEYDGAAEELVVLGDRSRLAQVLTNLLENALKYSPMGGPIRVTLTRTGPDALVSVADSGIGIPVDQQAHLFERFFRARNAPISGFGGLGLGLFICRHIVERHGGRIWVESEAGHGSTFRFTVPLLEDDARAP